MTTEPANRPVARSWSLRRRLLITAIVVVTGFMLLVGFALEQAFRASAMQASHDRLQARVYMLMGAADFDADGRLVMPPALPDPTLAMADSGNIGAIGLDDGTLLWQSESSLAIDLEYPLASIPGRPVATQATAGDTVFLTVAYPVIWELDSGAERRLVFYAAEPRARVDDAVAAFRGTLQWWLGGATLLLLLLQMAMLIWILKPLRQVATELQAVEAGRKERLDGPYPRELRPLTDNLNDLLRSNRARLRRYRNGLADLAHSLKTPLAVLRANAEELSDEYRATVSGQIERMSATIDYQLQRAATSGRSPLSSPVQVRPETERVVDSLAKVYHDKSLNIEMDIAADTVFVGEPGDLTQILGNLGDNACKWARHSVRFRAHNATDGQQRLVLTIEDDGPGIPDELRESVTDRGMRADSRTPGQGIGLAVVREMVVEVYGGRLEISRTVTGGTRIEVQV